MYARITSCAVAIVVGVALAAPLIAAPAYSAMTVMVGGSPSGKPSGPPVFVGKLIPVGP